MICSDTDIQVLRALNSLLGNNDLYNARLWNVIGGNALVRGFPIFFPLIALWFSSDDEKRRGRMLSGLLAVYLTTILSVWLQNHITPHIRPLLDPALHLHIVDPQWESAFDRRGSFPSDTATLYFSLAAIIFLENRLVGSFCFVWALTLIAFPRVVFAWHYPSDIVGSLVLGPGCVYLFTKTLNLGLPFERVLKLFESRMYIVHALLFIFLADAYNLFLGSQVFYKLVFGHA